MRVRVILSLPLTSTNRAIPTPSVYWDSIHGDHVTPRPIVTYNPECLSDDWEDKTIKGEVFRTRFKHTHLPPVTTYLMCEEGIQASHNAKDAKVFYAGAFADGFSLSHSGAMKSGIAAARSMGARPNADEFFTSHDFRDRPGFEKVLREVSRARLGPLATRRPFCVAQPTTHHHTP